MWHPHFYFLSYRVFCVIGDAEAAEGSVWEAMNFASHYKLDNLCAIFDVNRLGQSDPTMLEHDFETYKKRTEAFGWVQWININAFKYLNCSHMQKCNFDFCLIAK